jgi:hypothetical protein
MPGLDPGIQGLQTRCLKHWITGLLETAKEGPAMTQLGNVFLANKGKCDG